VPDAHVVKRMQTKFQVHIMRIWKVASRNIYNVKVKVFSKIYLMAILFRSFFILCNIVAIELDNKNSNKQKLCSVRQCF